MGAGGGVGSFSAEGQSEIAVTASEQSGILFYFKLIKWQLWTFRGNFFSRFLIFWDFFRYLSKWPFVKMTIRAIFWKNKLNRSMFSKKRRIWRHLQKMMTSLRRQKCRNRSDFFSVRFLFQIEQSWKVLQIILNFEHKHVRWLTPPLRYPLVKIH